MSAFIDITGQKFGNLTVLTRLPNQGTRAMWLCQCSCGNTCIARGSELRSGVKHSCGCIGRRATAIANTKHGDSYSRLYRVWRSMLNRCEYINEGNSSAHYHKLGITVCDAWKDYTVFKQWALANGYDPNAKRGECTLDRIDGTKGYCPENCRWVSMTVQNRNKLSYTPRTAMLTVDGVTKPIMTWAEEVGIPYKTLWRRLSVGWEPKKAITTPVRRYKRI